MEMDYTSCVGSLCCGVLLPVVLDGGKEREDRGGDGEREGCDVLL